MPKIINEICHSPSAGTVVRALYGFSSAKASAATPTAGFPSKWKMEGNIMPTTASMATRLWTISASRYHLMEFSSPPISQDFGGLFVNPAGSNPTSPGRVPSRLTGFGSKGKASDLSSFILRDLTPYLVDLAGATNAVAPTSEAAITVAANIVVDEFCSLDSVIELC